MANEWTIAFFRARSIGRVFISYNCIRTLSKIVEKVRNAPLVGRCTITTVREPRIGTSARGKEE